MSQKRRWRPNPPVIIASAVAAAAVMLACYPHAVRWFEALEAEPVEGHVALPVTGLTQPIVNPGFPWWAFITVFSISLLTTIVWRSGYEELWLTSLRETARVAARNARHFALRSEIERELDEHSRAKRSNATSHRFALGALALKSAADSLDDFVSTKEAPPLELPPVGIDALRDSGDIPTAPAAPEDAAAYAQMLPRMDSLGGRAIMPPPHEAQIVPGAEDGPIGAQETDGTS